MRDELCLPGSNWKGEVGLTPRPPRGGDEMIWTYCTWCKKEVRPSLDHLCPECRESLEGICAAMGRLDKLLDAELNKIDMEIGVLSDSPWTRYRKRVAKAIDGLFPKDKVDSEREM